MLRRSLPALFLMPLGVIACSSDDEPSPTRPDGGSATGGAAGSGGSSSEDDARVPGSGGAAPTSDSGTGGCAPPCGQVPDAAPPEKDAAPGDAHVEAAPPTAAPTCQLITDACGIIDFGGQRQDIRDCAALGGSDDATCQGQLDSCRTACAPSLCVRLGGFCHEPDPGSGPIHDCHEFNHRGAQSGASAEDVAWCFDEASRCFALCEAAQ